MDVLSTASAALGVVDVCLRLGKGLKSYAKKFVNINHLLTDLQSDIESLAKICTAIKDAYDHASQNIPSSQNLQPHQSLHTPQSLQSVQSTTLSPGFEREDTLTSSSEDAPQEARGQTATMKAVGAFPSSLISLNYLIKKDLNDCKKLVEEMAECVEAIVQGAEEAESAPGEKPAETSSADDEGAALAAKAPPGQRRNVVSRNLERAKVTYTRLHEQKVKHGKYLDIGHLIERNKVQISAYKQGMTIMLQIINYFYVTSINERRAVSIEKIGTAVQDFRRQFSVMLETMRQDFQSEYERDHTLEPTHGQWQFLSSLSAVHESLEFGLEILKKEQTTPLFDIPQAVSRTYTGRLKLLQDLEQVLLPSASNSPSNGQRVFVIHGLGGSGKTQFCCKFAYDNKDKLWGVMWVDASSIGRLKKSLINLFVRYGGGNRDLSDVGQALDWLSSLEHSWLLIIDNADQPMLDIAAYIPKSSMGCVLITTKCKKHTSLGTVGDGYYSFSGLEKDEATELLLRTSLYNTEDWGDFRAIAEHIAFELGYLALAIVNAGMAIQQDLCTFPKYIAYFQIACKQMREQSQFIKSLKASRRVSKADSEEIGSDDSDYDDDVDTERNMSIFATWDTCYLRLTMKAERGEQSAFDAMQLLDIFSFLDHRRVSKEIFKRAVTSAAIEKEANAASAKEALTARASGAPHGHLAAWLKQMGSSVVMAFLGHIQQGGAKLLPSLVLELRRSSWNTGRLNARIDKAFWELSQMALISKNDKEDTYLMHPFVQTWARERQSLAHQALVIEMTSSLLSASILLPPHDSKPEDNAYHLSLLPHVEYVTKSRTLISERILDERELRQRRGAAIFDRVYNLAKTPDVDDIRTQAKFGFIYAKGGLLDKACERLHSVQESLYRLRGKQSREARRVDQSLSDIYFSLGQAPKARALLQDLLARCEACLGKHHEDTYRVMSKLGRVLWLMGSYNDASKLQTAAVQGLEETLGKDAVDTLEAVDQLGSTVAKFWRPEDIIRAFGLHKRVVDTLSRNKDYGENDEHVLFATENMCRAAVLIKRRDAAYVSSSKSGQGKVTPPPIPIDPFASAPIGKGSFDPTDLPGETISGIHDAGQVVPEPPENIVPLMERVLRVRKKTLGKKHPYTLLSMVNYAITKAAVGELDDAEQVLRDGLEIAYTILPEKHIGILFGRQTLACVLRERGGYLEAGRILQQVSQYQKEMEASQGRFHPDRLATLIELSHCYFLAGLVDRSLQYIAEVLEGFGTITNESHPLMIQTRETHEQLRLVKRCRTAGTAEPDVRFPRYLYES